MPRRNSDFSAAVLSALAKRVGMVCSNPQCPKLTSGPHAESSRAVNIGVGAHISAASPGGPRYDPEMTDNARQSIENGIWLCQNCAKLIDSDESRYSVQILQEWKASAEHDAHLGIEGATKVAKEVGSPSHNVNSYFQTGGITAHTVNLHRAPDRVLDASTASQLLSALSDRGRSLRIEAIEGDQEALRFADSIATYLLANGVRVIGDPVLAVIGPNVKPLELFTGDSDYVLKVGPRPGA